MNDLLCSRRARRANRWVLLAFGVTLSVPLVAHAQPDTSDSSSGKKEAAKPAAADSEAGDAADDADAGADAADAAAAAEAEAEADKELAAEEAKAASAMTKPPAKGKGGLWGVVKDTKFNEAVIEAQVQVVGRKERTFTDVEGRYRLDLPPGKYRVRITFELHQPSRIDDVEIKAGQLAHVDAKLTPDESAVEEVVIEEAVDTTTSEGVALTRKQSAAVGDGVGRAEIARTPDKNAAEAAQRVVGATVVGGRFVFVRGLGERYTNALLNGAPLPSPEPDRNTVPLDLFPSMVLDSITIVKQFTPDMPADFAGGSVRIQTRDFPRQALFQIALTGGYNTEAAFRKRPGYYGSSTDWLGFDSGRRALPPGIPNRRLGQSETTTDEQVGYGYRFNTLMSTMRKATPPNHGLTIVAGNGYKIGPDSKLGVLLALSYSRTYQIRDIVARKFFVGKAGDASNTLLVGDDFAGTQGIDTVRWGAFGNASLELGRHHTLSVLGLRSQTADDLTSELQGQFQSSAGSTYHTTHLEDVTRSLNFLQVRGEHRYPSLSGLQINWHASIASASRQQPDSRDLRYRQSDRNGEPGWEFSPDASGTHSFYDQSDRTLAAGLDVLQPVVKSAEHETKLKFGGLLTSRDRAFRARRFQLVPSSKPGALYRDASFCYGAAWSTGCPSQLFRPDLIRPDGLLLDEWTFNLDQYETGLDVYAMYGMVDSKLTSDLRAIAGVRSEITYQSFTGFDPFDRAGTAKTSQIFQTDWLPAGSLVYAVGKASNARFGVSQTLARPQLREITPTLFTSYSGDNDVQGNEKLQITKITNLDLRFENFPTLREVLAVSLFYKHFKKPIEEIVGSGGKLGFTNADGAYAAGVELEGRKTLDVLAPQLKAFTVIGNLTLVKSQVELGNKGANSTNASRPLSYQSPYVINLALDWENPNSKTELRALYNVSGPRITASGADGLPDVYELPRHQVDVSVAQKFGKHFEGKLQALNILNAPVEFAYRGVQAFKSKLSSNGVESFESLGNNPVVRRYVPGATFAMTVTYNY